MNIFLLLLGLALILGGADLLTDGASALAKRLRMPEFLIGLTIVAIGTSTPELVVSVLSAIGGKTDMALGNVVGSNLFNGFVILGLCALIRPIPYTRDNIRYDIPFGILASVLLLAVASDRFLHLGTVDTIGRGEGIVMLLLYGAFMAFTIRHARRTHAVTVPSVPQPRTDTQAQTGTPQASAVQGADAQPQTGTPQAGAAQGPALWKLAAMIVGGLVLLVGGGELFLRAATAIARALGVSDSVIALTLVAGGTSLPELAASIVSLVKGRSAMALGNAIGSNIANILLILGLSATIRPLSMGGITHADLAAVLSNALLLWIAAFTFRRRAIDRTEGALFLLLYAAYLWHLLR